VVKKQQEQKEDELKQIKKQTNKQKILERWRGG